MLLMGLKLFNNPAVFIQLVTPQTSVVVIHISGICLESPSIHKNLHTYVEVICEHLYLISQILNSQLTRYMLFR